MTVVNIDPYKEMEVTKTASVTDNGDNYVGAGDVINYTITVENKGNVTLTGLTIVDTLTDGNAGTLSLSNGPNFSGANQGSGLGTIKAGETATYLAYYIITPASAATGSIINSAKVTGSSPGQTNNVSDTSDDGDDTDGNTVSDTTDITINPIPSIEVTKTASVNDVNSNSQNDNGDIITYTITVVNTGNLPLSSFVLNDNLTDGNSGVLSYNSSITLSSVSGGSTSSTLAIGGTYTYTATYTIQQAVAYTGFVNNTVNVVASSPGQSGNVSDTSDDGDDTDGNTTDDPTEVITVSNATIEVTKTAVITQNDGNNTNDAGDLITYTIGIKNTGNVNLTSLTLSDTLTDGAGNILNLTSGPTFSQASGASTTYAINVTAASTESYTLNGTNRNGNVSGGDPSLTFNVGDVINFAVNAAGHPFYIKTAAGTGTGNQVGGVSNNGSQNGTVSWTPTTPGTYYYQCSNHAAMVGVITINANSASTSSTILASGVVTYTATYLIQQNPANTGSIKNTVLVTASLSLIHI